MRRTKTSTKLLGVLIGATLFATACGGDDGGSEGTAPPATDGGETTQPGEETTPPSGGGGTITYAAEQEYTSYNNGTADQVLFANTLVLNMVQPGPFISMPDLTYELWTDLMESAEVVSEDPQIIEYVVKEGAIWEDGEPIDCDDFYLAWMANNGKAGNRKAPDGSDELDADGNPIPVFATASTVGYEDIESVECSEDGRTITTTYSKGFADWQALFSGLIPAHVVEREAGVEDITAELDDAQLQAAGEFWSTGFSGDNAANPDIALSGSWYTIADFSPGQSLTLVRNENFYGTPANADEIVFLQVPDATAQPAALANQEVQVISPQPNPDLIAQLRAIAGVNVILDQGVTFEHFDFNQANPILAELAVRQAFALCIDRQELVDTLVKPLNPDAEVLNNRIYVPGSPDYQDNSGEFGTRDVERAKQILEEAGWTLGSDGIYEKDGQKLSFRIGRRDPNPRRQQTVELVQAQCKEAGFDIVDDPAENFNSERLPASDYDVALFAWVATAALSSNTSIYVPPDQGGDQNWNNYSNPRLRELFDEANAELDPARRAELMNEIDQVIWEDMATIPLFQFTDLYAHSGNVSGVSANGPLGVTWNANEWALVE